ncbi:MAG: hypothetical protein J6X18_02645 [Bacteroidales bacterium]|nr:hypothetical protein [Bacteroidales bacterium]
MKKILFISFLAFCACDDGDVMENIKAESSGRTVKIAASVSGIENWPSGYNVVVAGFGDSKYADISKNIFTATADTLVLNGIGNDVKTIEICAINRLRERIATFYENDISNNNEAEIILDAGAVQADMFSGIQKTLFNPTCSACHGGGKSAAAGLYLTEGKSYDALVNVASSKATDGSVRVVPGDAANSFMYKVVTGTDGVLSFDHSNMITEEKYIKLIENWITKGIE